MKIRTLEYIHELLKHERDLRRDAVASMDETANDEDKRELWKRFDEARSALAEFELVSF